MNELQFQKFLTDTLKAEGNYGCKLNNRFSVGVSDLLIRIDNTLWLAEVKRVTTARPDAPDLNLKLDVSEHQLRFLREFRMGMIVVLTQTSDYDKVRVSVLPRDARFLTRTPHELNFIPRRNKLTGTLSELIKGASHDNFGR